jgi:hypothetical protein
MTVPGNRIPEIAGISTYEKAARIGYSVEENVERLLRLHWTERRLMDAMLAHLPSTPVWEAKCALALQTRSWTRFSMSFFTRKVRSRC